MRNNGEKGLIERRYLLEIIPNTVRTKIHGPFNGDDERDNFRWDNDNDSLWLYLEVYENLSIEADVS